MRAYAGCGDAFFRWLPPLSESQNSAHLPTDDAAPTRKQGGRQLWKIVPGLLLSAFFLWRTLSRIHYADLRSLHFAQPVWLLVLVLALLAGYTTRVFRWWYMLRGSGAPAFSVCARVLLTSFAANNVLPFRIGDFLRVFSYSGDLGAPSSTILSTVILERLLDVFMLLLFLVTALAGAGAALPPMVIAGHSLSMLAFAVPVLVLCALGLLLLLFGAALLQRLVQSLVRSFSAGPRTAKLERWALLMFDAVLKMNAFGRLLILFSSVAVWIFEGLIFVSAARMLGVPSGPRGPWLALSLSNLSYLLPSSPGAIGTFEYFSRLGMVSQGAPEGVAGLYGLFVHVVVLFTITGAGGIAFLAHRAARGPLRKPLAEEVAALPAELP